MKHPIMLVCAMIAAMGVSAMAEENAAPAAAAKVEVKAERAKGAKMTEAQREAALEKRLAAIKAKDEALYKELIALKETNPAAFKAKMKELGKGENKGKGEHKGKGKKAAEAAAK